MRIAYASSVSMTDNDTMDDRTGSIECTYE